MIAFRPLSSNRSADHFVGDRVNDSDFSASTTASMACLTALAAACTGTVQHPGNAVYDLQRVDDFVRRTRRVETASMAAWMPPRRIKGLLDVVLQLVAELSI